MSAQRRACARCGRHVCTTGSRPVAVFVCHDCQLADPWYVQAVAS